MHIRPNAPASAATDTFKAAQAAVAPDGKVYDVPDWLAQPAFVKAAEANAPKLQLSSPPSNTLSVGGSKRSVPFVAFDIDGPAGSAFASQPTPKGKLSDERKDPSGADVNLVTFSHTVCNSVGHALHVHALNGTSNHAIIAMDGSVHQLVDLKRKAFPAARHNERVIGLTFQNPVDPRVADAPDVKDGMPRSLISESIPRHGSEHYTYQGVSDAQKKTAAQIVRWLSQQPEFDIDAKAADPDLVPADEAAVDAAFGSYKGAVGLYQLRPIHIAPGFDAMASISRRLATA